MTVEQKIKEAHILIEKGLYAESIPILSDLALNYQNFNVSYLLGFAYQRTDNFNQAEKYYNDAIRLKQDHCHAYLGLGICYQKQGKFTEAINFIENAIKINRYFDDAYNSLGYTYKLIGDFNKAIEIYKRGIEVLFDNVYHFIIKNKEFVEEEAVVDKFKTNLWDEMLLKTILHKAAEDGLKSICLPTPETATKLRENNPYGTELYFDEGDNRTILPNFINNFADKLSRNIRYANILNNIGMVLLELDELKMAREYFIEAIVFTPEHVEFLNPINNLEYTEV